MLQHWHAINQLLNRDHTLKKKSKIMKKLEHFVMDNGKVMVEHPKTGKLLDFEGFWLLNDNLRCSENKTSPVASLLTLIENTIRFISLHTDNELLADIPEVQQVILWDLYLLKDELKKMTDV